MEESVIRSNYPARNVYYLLGEEIATLVDEKQEAGYREARWDGTNDPGTSVASGAYIIRMYANGLL